MTAARSLRPTRGALSDLEEVILKEWECEEGERVVAVREREEKTWREVCGDAAAAAAAIEAIIASSLELGI